VITSPPSAASVQIYALLHERRHEELVRLRKALRIAEEERDILKKATFFAKQSR